MADHTASRRLPLLVGLGALAGSTLLLCLGQTIALLIIGRILQGISAAMVWTVGLALLTDTVGYERVGQAMGYVAIAMSVAILIAPLLGGLVYARAGYYAVFYMAFGMIILDVVLRVLLVEKKIARRWDRVETGDTVGEGKVHEEGNAVAEKAAVEAGGVLQPSPRTSPTRAQNPGERAKIKSKHSVVLLLTSRRLLAALFCTLAQATLMTSWDAVLPLYTNRIFGWSSIGAGLIFFPLILPSFLSPIFGYWSDKKGPRVPTTLGFLLAIPFLVLLRLVDHESMRQKVLLCALLACLGLALSIALTPILAEIAYVVGHKEKSHPGAFGGKGAYAMAYGLFNMAFAGGMLIGPIWGGLVVQGAGWGTMCWSLSLLSIVGACVSFLFVGGWVGKSGKAARLSELEGRNGVDGRIREGEV